MNDSIFRYYDIRGKVGIDFQIEDTYNIAHAIAFYFRQKNPSMKSIALGIDGRTSSPAIKEQVQRAFLDAGIDVYFIGMCPTPTLYFTLFMKPEIDGGLMITASHNGPEYNGIKICFDKKIVALDEIDLIKNIFHSSKRIEAASGQYHELPMNSVYIEWLTDHFAHLKALDLSMAIDCGSGATATIIPELVRRMNWQNATVLFDEIDGDFSYHLPDPTVPENVADLKQFVKTNNCAIGAAFDGDGDRMVPMTGEGELVSGDKVLALFAKHMLPGRDPFSVVFDVKSSAKLSDLLTSWSLKPVMSATGHALIKKSMAEHHALVAGEISCHFFFADRYFGFDDGIYALMRLLEILHASEKNLTEQLTIFPPSFSTTEIRIACVQQKKAICAIAKKFEARDDVMVTTVDGARVIFSDGWGLVRASNTEPLLSMRFEADGLEGLTRYKKEFAYVLKEFVDERVLCEKLGI